MDSEQTHEDQLAFRDQLSTLPVEILSEIFKLAYAPSSPPTGPICRALLPFDRSARFHRLEVMSVQQLRKLSEVLEGNENLAPWIEELSLSETDGSTDPSNPSLSDRQLKGFFEHLVSLKSLCLASGTKGVTRLVLSSPFARAYLPNLTRLSLHHPFDSPHPFDPTPLQYLPNFPRLSALTIEGVTDERLLLPGLPAANKSKSLPSLSNLTELTIDSNVADQLAAGPLIKSCPSLLSLTLRAQNDEPDYRALLSSIGNKTSLSSLTLRTPAFYDDYSRPCHSLLPSFIGLGHLYLGEGTFSLDIFTVLRTLPRLTSLGFGEGASVPVDKFRAFVGASTRFQQLETLTLDMVRGEVGWRIIEDGGGRLHDDADLHSHLGPGWVVPPFSFIARDHIRTRDQAADAIHVARENGVQVKGSLLEAVEVMDKIRAELKLATGVFALRSGDLERARALLGAEKVEELTRASGGAKTGETSGDGSDETSFVSDRADEGEKTE
ncbi:hypothetical protein JCM6882_000451 [Rhodosporidiobolus microsporus]